MERTTLSLESCHDGRRRPRPSLCVCGCWYDGFNHLQTICRKDGGGVAGTNQEDVSCVPSERRAARLIDIRRPSRRADLRVSVSSRRGAAATVEPRRV